MRLNRKPPVWKSRPEQPVRQNAAIWLTLVIAGDVQQPVSLLHQYRILMSAPWIEISVVLSLMAQVFSSGITSQ
jgi:hypothetical protein